MGAGAASSRAANPPCPCGPRFPRQVLLVGGATRMPAIRRFVRNMTGLDAAEFVVDPDLVTGMRQRLLFVCVCMGHGTLCCMACLQLPVVRTSGLASCCRVAAGPTCLLPTSTAEPQLPHCCALQAVALGAAVQAGIYEGQVCPASSRKSAAWCCSCQATPPDDICCSCACAVVAALVALLLAPHPQSRDSAFSAGCALSPARCIDCLVWPLPLPSRSLS